MSQPYTEKVGSRNEFTAVDSEQVMNSLNKGNFELSTTASTYNPEEYTTSYIGSVFNAIKNIEDSWKKCKEMAGKYISNFEDVPLPEDLPHVPNNFEDEVEEEASPAQTIGGLGVASVTATSLKIRKDSNMDSQVVGYCGNGDNFEIVGYSENGNWIEIKLPDGSKGYISKKYASVIENSNKQSPNIQEEVVETIEELPKTQKKTIQTEILEDSAKNESKSVVGHVKTHGKNLNVRDENNNIIGSLKNNSNVKIVGEVTTKDGKWYEIDLGDGKKARVSSDWVVTDSKVISNSTTQNVSSTGNSSIGFGTVSTKNSNLNVRSGASLDSKVVGSLPRNAKVEVLEYNKNSKWAKILYDGEERYVYKELIKMKGE